MRKDIREGVQKHMIDGIKPNYAALAEYCGRFLPVVRFFLPLFAGRFTNVCGIVYQ